MKNKKIIIISIIAVVVIIAVWLVWFLKFSREETTSIPLDQAGTTVEPFKVEFLSTEQKMQEKISDDLKIQPLIRDASGKLLIYKIIKNDAAVVTDLTAIGPISPRAKN
jgi:uncharacterized membrane protein YvbJ